MGHIFISYSHKDTAYVEKLEAKLIREGFDVWVDHRIDYGSRWTKEIEKAINTCDAYIVVMSETARESQWVERERIHAEKRRKPFFPLLLKGDAWFELGNIQFMDVRGGKLPPKAYYENIARFVPRKENPASVGAGVESNIPAKKNLQLWVGGAVLVGLLILGGFALSNIFDKTDPPVEVTADVTVAPATIPAVPVDKDPTLTPEPEGSSLIPPADAQLGDTWTRPTDGMVMSYISAGEFQMGSEDGEDDEQPVHTVYLDAFWMDQTEVTNTMYLACVEAGRCEEPSDRTYLDNPAYANHPVVYVNWEAANNYCEKVGGRLPTEAEWEKAARGGLNGKEYPWGDEKPVCSLYVENGAKFNDNENCKASGTETVASFSSNGYGLYDMAGNVWEWVADLYGENYYADSPSSNPLGINSGYMRILRGGSWAYSDYHARSSYRYDSLKNSSLDSIGFRCARSASE